MTKIDDGGPAFPVISDVIGHNGGMSLRDAFAMNAMPCFLSALLAEKVEPIGEETGPEMIARCAYQTADAMLAARAKGGAE